METKICRICYESHSTKDNKLFSPCLCNGTSKYVHQECLENWRDHNDSSSEAYHRCMECGQEYSLEKLNEIDRLFNILEFYALHMNVFIFINIGLFLFYFYFMCDFRVKNYFIKDKNIKISCINTYNFPVVNLYTIFIVKLIKTYYKPKYTIILNIVIIIFIIFSTSILYLTNHVGSFLFLFFFHTFLSKIYHELKELKNRKYVIEPSS